MGRTFVAITEDELREKIRQSALPNMEEGWNEPGLPGEILVLSRNAQIKKDLKIEFDFENFECETSKGYNGAEGITGLRTLSNGLAYVGCSAGGDWEIPVFFIVYWDGQKLRAYIPTKGNPFNRTEKQAYGNNAQADYEDMKKVYPELTEDIEKCYTPSGTDIAVDGHSYEVDPEFDPNDVVPECDTQSIIEDIEDRIKGKPKAPPTISDQCDDVIVSDDPAYISLQPTKSGKAVGKEMILTRASAAVLIKKLIAALD